MGSLRRTRHQPVDRARVVHHVLTNGQRATDDVMVEITFRETGETTRQYASSGRAAYMLQRYGVGANHPYAEVRRVELEEAS